VAVTEGVVAVGTTVVDVAGGGLSGGFDVLLVGGEVTTVGGLVGGVVAGGGSVVAAVGGGSVTAGVELGSNTTKGGKTITLFWSSTVVPGVRKVSSHPNGVKIAGKTGCTGPFSCFGRLPGSRLDCISAFMFQLGAKRMAICPAINIKITPMGMIKINRVQSRRSLLLVEVVINLPPSVFQRAKKQKMYFPD
jgi:hypothetical protein